MNSTSYWYIENVHESQDITRKVLTCTNDNAHLPRISSRLKNLKQIETGSKTEAANDPSHQDKEKGRSLETIGDVDALASKQCSSKFF